MSRECVKTSGQVRDWPVSWLVSLGRVSVSVTIQLAGQFREGVGERDHSVGWSV